MSARSPNAAVPATPPPLALFRRRLSRFVRVVVGGYDRWLERQALADLDDRLLDDIGLTPAERDRECVRSPWDGIGRR